MNAFVRFLCLIFGISVDGGAAQRQQWAERRRELGIEPPEGEGTLDHDHAEPEREPAHAHAPQK